MKTYYVGSIPVSDELYHHGILGQRWGHRNGPPYPLDAEKHSKAEQKAGWKNSLENKDNQTFYKESSVSIKTNKDGSQTVPKGFIFNRVGQQNMDINKSGALYVSHGKDDAARYVKSLGPSLIGKLMHQYGTTVQHIAVKDDLKLPSDSELQRQTLSFIKSNDNAKKAIDDSIASYAYDLNSSVLDNADLTDKNKQLLVYSYFTLLGDGSYADTAREFYSYMIKQGYDALPDMADRMSGTSKTALILMNPNKVELQSKTLITKEIFKSGKKHASKLAKIPISDILK